MYYCIDQLIFLQDLKSKCFMDLTFSNILSVESNSQIVRRSIKAILWAAKNTISEECMLISWAVLCGLSSYIQENPTCRPTPLCAACSNNCCHLSAFLWVHFVDKLQSKVCLTIFVFVDLSMTTLWNIISVLCLYAHGSFKGHFVTTFFRDSSIYLCRSVPDF